MPAVRNRLAAPWMVNQPCDAQCNAVGQTLSIKAPSFVAPPANVPRSRKVYSLSFKRRVVEWALKLPEQNRIKPTARAFPGVEPVRPPPLSHAASQLSLPPEGKR